MKTIFNSILLFVCCLGLLACNVLPQNLKLAPNVTVTESSQGKSAVITVKVVDERADSILGHISSASFSGRADIVTSQDLPALIQGEVIKGLFKKGFNALPCEVNERPVLKVVIQTIRYDVIQGVWASRIETNAILKAVATVNGTTHETIYRAEDEKKLAFQPTMEKNEIYINQMLNDVIKVLLNDPQLIDYLSNA
ncbi:MAG: YajG family lipoprotein [Desulfobacterales bacterium]|jgi:uncharacterized lipoprotein YajG|nr:YajG family lipoprotein [Desulfobacterales bacterium]